MEKVNLKEGFLEVQEFSVDQIIEMLSVQNENKDNLWLEDLVRNLLKGNPASAEAGTRPKCCYLLWKSNRSAVGFSYLYEQGEKSAVINFRVFEGAIVSPNNLQVLLETSIEKYFNLYGLEKILFDCGKHCDTEVSRTFIRYFQPHPVGWVHFNDGKYVLTRGRFERTEEEFYKM